MTSSPSKPWENSSSTAHPSSSTEIPPRPATDPSRPLMNTSTGYNPYSTGYSGYNTGYNGYNTGYSGYNTGYSGYNPGYGMYNSPYASGYGATGYGYNRFGYGGPFGPGMGPPVPGEPSLSQTLEQSTQRTFQTLQQLVQAFGGFAQMLESTFFATHSSFMAMVKFTKKFIEIGWCSRTIFKFEDVFESSNAYSIFNFVHSQSALQNYGCTHTY